MTPRNAQETKAHKLLAKLVARLCGTETPQGFHQFTIPTTAGPLGVSVHKNPRQHSWNIFCRFEDVERALPIIGRDYMNPFSGKWNHFYPSDYTPAQVVENFAAMLQACELLPGVTQAPDPAPGKAEPVAEPRTAVLFRCWRDKAGDVIALFPLLAESNGRCMSYQHVGQHSAADPALVIRRTRPATPAEYGDLAAELAGIGYVLDVRQRMPSRQELDAARKA